MSNLTCPVCKSQLQEVARHDVTIDTCPQCRGVWLDRGELDKIIADLRDDGPRRDRDYPREQYRRDYDDDDYEDRVRSSGHGTHAQPYRKKSKMETFMDIFD